MEKTLHKSVQLKQSRALQLVEKYWLLMFTLLVGIGAGILEPSFFRIGNLSSIVSTASITAVAACGVVYVQAVGELDFSTGAIMSWSASMIVILLHQQYITNYYVAVLVALASCLIGGLFNAFCHVILGIPAFLATLASALVFRSFTLLITDNTTIYKGKWDSEVFTFIGQRRLFGVIPWTFIVFLFIAIIMTFVLERARLGRSMYLVGGNPRACEYVGISQRKYKLIAFLVCSFLCGVSGIMQASVANGGGVSSGDSYQLQTILVCILGATFIKKGITNIPGAFLGSLLLTMIANAILLVGASNFMQYAAQGIVLLLAVLISTRIRVSNERA